MLNQEIDRQPVSVCSARVYRRGYPCAWQRPEVWERTRAKRGASEQGRDGESIRVCSERASSLSTAVGCAQVDVGGMQKRGTGTGTRLDLHERIRASLPLAVVKSHADESDRIRSQSPPKPQPSSFALLCFGGTHLDARKWMHARRDDSKQGRDNAVSCRRCSWFVCTLATAQLGLGAARTARVQ